MSVQGTPVAAGPAGTMTLTQARALFDTFSRLAGSSSVVFNATDRDNAILSVGRDFVETTRATLRTDAVALSADSAVADFSGIADFRPDRARRYYVASAGDLEATDPATLRRWQDCRPCAGRPRYLAFDTWASAAVYPTPDDDYALSVAWCPPFTAFAAGTGSPDSVTFNVPDEWMSQIVEFGACGKLMMVLKETRADGEAKWAKYVAWRDSLKGRGGTGVKVAFGRPPRRGNRHDTTGLPRVT